MAKRKYLSFKEFYPYYLSEHDNVVCRRLHYAGSMSVLMALIITLVLKQWWALLLLPVLGYGPAWIGHFYFEKNKPATFDYPLYSFCGDWVMLKDALTRLFQSQRSQRDS